MAFELRYAQVEGVLAREIAMLPAGARLPAEDKLIDRFGVSRTTIRKAIQTLVDRGAVEIQRGRGTFVAQPKITQELTELTGFVEDMCTHGRTASARLIDTRVVAATDAVATQLGVAPGTNVMRIQRVRLGDGIAMSFDETYLPREIGERVITNDLETDPIFMLLEQKYGIPLVDAEYRLEAVAADEHVAKALGVAGGSPIFRIERTSYTTGRAPVDYEQLHYRGDLIRFVTRLARRRDVP